MENKETKRAWLLLAEGFEETEAIATWDALVRGGIEAEFVSITDNKEVIGAHGLALNAQKTLQEIQEDMVDALVLPGGMPGAQNLYDSQAVREQILAYQAAGKVIAAICASPAIVFGQMGLLKGCQATCYPGMEEGLQGAVYTAAPTTIDGQIITGKGPAYAFHFGLAILKALVGNQKAEEVANGLLLQ